MFDFFIRSAVLVLAVLFGVMAGFFFAFSNTVMPGLDLMAGTEALHAMQNINIAVRNSVFFGVFASTPALSIALTVLCLVSGRYRRIGILLLLAMAIYLIGVVVLTGAINVPMNRSLALLASMTANDWLVWSAEWTLSNHARMVASVVSLALAIVAACRMVKIGQDGVARSLG